MDMKQCPNGHFYDSERNAVCPYCTNGADINATRPLGNDAGVHNMEAPAFPKTAPAGNFASPSPGSVVPPTMPLVSPETNKTVALQINEKGIDPVRGWLVCVDGEKKGRDFRIHSEKNYIGRAKSNDIALDFDDSISRESHAVITYDVRKNKFWFQSGDGKSNIYINDEIVLVPVELVAYDVISIGKTSLMFVPFCSDRFVWEK